MARRPADRPSFDRRGCVPARGRAPASIDAALHPDTADKYLYFLAIPEGDGKHVFAKTAKEHAANKKKYGYPP